jgi:nucleoside-diphosphate-sugar epimerase
MLYRAARGPKVSALRTVFAKYPKFEAIEIADISSGDLTDALTDVDAVIHAAASVPGRADAKTTIKSALDGSLHVIHEAHRMGIRKFVFTSSIVTCPMPEGPFTVDCECCPLLLSST